MPINTNELDYTQRYSRKIKIIKNVIITCSCFNIIIVSRKHHFCTTDAFHSNIYFFVVIEILIVKYICTHLLLFSLP